jgi:flagellar protein FlaG
MSDALQALSAGRPEMPARPEPAQAAKAAVAPERARQSTPVQPEEPKQPARRKGPDAEQMRKEIQEAVERLNEQMRKEGRNLAFSIDKKVDQTVITVKNSHTGEVVRQIPDESLLHVAHSIEDMKGLLYDKES